MLSCSYAPRIPLRTFEPFRLQHFDGLCVSGTQRQTVDDSPLCRSITRYRMSHCEPPNAAGIEVLRPRNATSAKAPLWVYLIPRAPFKHHTPSVPDPAVSKQQAITGHLR